MATWLVSTFMIKFTCRLMCAVEVVVVVESKNRVVVGA